MHLTDKPFIFPLLFLLIGMVTFPLLGVLLSAFTFPPELARYVFSILVIAIVLFLSQWFLGLEKISFSAVNLKPDKNTWLRLILGCAIGVLLSGTMLLVLFFFSELSLERDSGAQSMFPFLLSAIIFFPLAYMEELVFRGYPFFRLSESLNIRWVILLTAILFALYHYNGSQSVISLLIGPGIWGVTFGVAAYLSNSLAVPLGIHTSANFLLAMLGLKVEYVGMWVVTMDAGQADAVVFHEQLGMWVQLGLLVVTILIFEMFHLRKNHRII